MKIVNVLTCYFSRYRDSSEIDTGRFVLKSMTKGFLIAFFWTGSAMACSQSAQMFICPGDTVVDTYGNRGHASAVNPFEQTVAINYGGDGNNIFSIPSVALGAGCLEGYCVGDFAVDQYGNKGHIDAVNPYNRTVAINYGGSRDNIFTINQVYLGLGCSEGYCINDKVIDSNGNEGAIDAINRYTGDVAVRYLGNVDNLYPVKRLASSGYRETYGDSARAFRLYPEFRTDNFLSADLHFSVER